MAKYGFYKDICEGSLYATACLLIIFVSIHYMGAKKATEPWIIVSYELKSVLTEIDKKLVKSRIYILIYYIH